MNFLTLLSIRACPPSFGGRIDHVAEIADDENHNIKWRLANYNLATALEIFLTLTKRYEQGIEVAATREYTAKALETIRQNQELCDNCVSE